jgi:phenylalanyl-tRNA synthetase beta chain
MNLRYGRKEITPDLTPKKIKISLENTNKLLGIGLKEKELKKLIEKMGHNYNSKDNSVEVASWRIDVLHEVDIIEDVAIAYGYENFVPEIPEIATTGKEDEKEMIKKKLSEILSGLEMVEVSNYHLTNKRDQIEKMNLIEKQEDFIEVKESKTEYDILRKNLAHLLLKNFSENVDSEYPQQIFEIGRVFCLDEEKGEIKEKEMLAAAISPGNFTRIKQVLEYLFRMIGKEAGIIFREATEIPGYFIEGRTAEILFKGRKIGFASEIHPKILKNWKIKMPVALYEIKLDDFLEEFL